MKVDNANGQKKMSRNEQKEAQIRAKLAAKFGEKVLPKKKEDKVEITSKVEKRPEPGDDNFADVKNNAPDSEETKAKLKGLLRTGGFQFSDKERSALSEILK